MEGQSHYALFLVDDGGVEWFAGAFETKESAETKGAASGKSFVIKPAVLDQ